MFQIPFELQTEDKIFGGLLSIRQLAWCALPLVVLVQQFFIDRGYLYNEYGEMQIDTGAIFGKILLMMGAACIGIYMSFIKMGGLNADKYTFKMLKYRVRKRKFRYERGR
jgi:hypothetical protein